MMLVLRQLLLFVLATFVVVPILAADEITLDQATGGIMKIDGNGTYKVDAGRTLKQIVFIAKLQNSTQESSVMAKAANGKWDGQLLLVAGKYTVKADLYTSDGKSTFIKSSSEIKDVEVTKD